MLTVMDYCCVLVCARVGDVGILGVHGKERQGVWLGSGRSLIMCSLWLLCLAGLPPLECGRFMWLKTYHSHLFSDGGIGSFSNCFLLDRVIVLGVRRLDRMMVVAHIEVCVGCFSEGKTLIIGKCAYPGVKKFQKSLKI